jgi:O-antigen ligase
MMASSNSRLAVIALVAGLLAITVLGAASGAMASLLAQSEMKWLVFALMGMTGLLAFALTANKDRVLTTVFILGLQLDVYLRLAHGRAGSLEGIAIPFVALAGMALIVWRFFAYGAPHFRQYRFDGLARWPIVAILATTVLSILTTSEQFVGVSRLVFDLELFFVYWLTYNLVRTEADTQSIVKLALVMLVVQSLVLYVQTALGINFSLVGNVSELGEVPRPGGTVSSNPAGFASFITPPLFLALAFFLSRGKQWRPKGAAIAAIMGAAAIGLTFTRAAWAGLVLGGGLLAMLLARRRVARWHRIAAIALVIAVGVLALLPTMSARLTNDYGGNANVSAWEERWGLMRIAFNMIAHHPINGVGAGAYQFVFKHYIPPGLNQWLYTVHNEFLLRAAETGVLGMIAFIALVIAGFRIGIRLMRAGQPQFVTIGAAWSAALLTLVWQMSWVPWTGFSYNAMLWFMLGAMDGTRRLIDERHTATVPIKSHQADVST